MDPRMIVVYILLDVINRLPAGSIVVESKMSKIARLSMAACYGGSLNSGNPVRSPS
jgi:hypothetical protein